MGSSPAESQPRCQVCGAEYAGGERFCSIDGGAIVAPAGPKDDPRIGRTVDGRYFVRQLIGEGGMGIVFAADHIGLDKPVAIKFLSKSDDGDADALARFRREARVASRIVHEHVVQIFDVGTHDGLDYIVMELVDGRDLHQTLVTDGAFAVARAVRIAVQMLRGLQAIHHARIVHRDIKPGNVLLTEHDRDRDFVKIMDFGISKSLTRSAAVGTITNTGKVMGTPQYMAPEQLAGLPSDHRADLYAVGLTLYAMLVGEAPFATSSFTRLAQLHLSVEAPSLDAFRPGLPPALVAVVARTLAKSPDDRYPDAAALADALEAIEVGGADELSVDGTTTVSSKPMPRHDAVATPEHGAATVVASRRANGEASRPAFVPVPPTVPVPAVIATIARPHRLPWVIAAGAVVVAAIAIVAMSRHAEAPARVAIVDAAVAAAAVLSPVVTPDAAPRSIDAGLAVASIPIDAGVHHVAATHVPAPVPDAAGAGAGSYCACVWEGFYLCPKLGKPLCTCGAQRDGDATNSSLCKVPFVDCPCAPGDTRCQASCDQFYPARKCANYVTIRESRFDQPCHGFYGATNQPIGGTYSCDLCPGIDRRSYRGKSLDKCTGLVGFTGAEVSGKLDLCESRRTPLFIE